MQFDEFLEAVQKQGDFRDREQALRASRATLVTLSERIVGGEATDLGSELPHELRGYIDDVAKRSPDGEIFDAGEFCRRIADRADGDGEEDGRRIAQAVLTVVKDAISAGEYEDVLGQLPDDIRALMP